MLSVLYFLQSLLPVVAIFPLNFHVLTHIWPRRPRTDTVLLKQF